MPVTSVVDTEKAAANASPARATAGGKLKAGREAAGLSLDAVARQLKLAPRQVQALEDDDWQRLPGRTFLRGFARNYARFVRIDPDAVVALLPATDFAPSFERPAAARPPMGEIPRAGITKPSPLRWLFPLLLLAVAVAIAYVELSRSRPAWLHDLLAPVMLGSRADSSSEVPTSTPGTAKVELLPNPAAGGSVAPAAPSNATPSGATDPQPAAPTTPAAPASAAPPVAEESAALSTKPATTGETPLVLTFRGTSWVEVKDAGGRVIAQMTGGAGMTQTISAVPPIELSLGNAPEVDVNFRGQPIDLARYTRGNVARVSLK